MDYFKDGLPAHLKALPDGAKQELASLLLNNGQNSAIELPLDIKAVLQEVITKVDNGNEVMSSADDVLLNLRNKFI